jgi:hypothetical protein
MKKVFTLLTALMFAFATLTTVSASNSFTYQQHMTKAGKPDRRYKENKKLTKAGKPDMRFKSNNPNAGKKKKK